MVSRIFKLFEKHVTYQIRFFTLNFKLITKSAQGLKHSAFCQTALQCNRHLATCYGSGNLIRTTFIYFAKTISSITLFLLKKLKCYNFDNMSIDWFASYLRDHIQSVKWVPVHLISYLSLYMCRSTTGINIGSPSVFIVY